MISKTLSPENQAKIICPVFHAETRIAGCFVLRDLWARGEGPADKRQGCQCALSAGKCPIPVMLGRMIREPGNDPCHSAEPKLINIDDDILDRIAPVLVMDSTMRRFTISAGEEKALLKGNEDARSGKRVIVKKPRRKDPPVQMEEIKAAETSASTDASELVTAAQSGDMSAAINAETSNAPQT